MQRRNSKRVLSNSLINMSKDNKTTESRLESKRTSRSNKKVINKKICNDLQKRTDDTSTEDRPKSVEGNNKRTTKELRKIEASKRRLWEASEDKAIIQLVKKYGIKKWTYISHKLQEKYKIYGRSGKQCRER